MKSKSLIACLLATMVSLQIAFAAEPSGYAEIISKFITAHMSSDARLLNAALSDDAKVKIPRQDKLMIWQKSELISALRANNGVVQNCAASYQLIEKTDAIVLARVDFNYPDFVQRNYLTLERNGSAEWKITQVCKISLTTNGKKTAAYPVVSAFN